ncbi:unnamed protein product [Symbiodinium sp. CCMP2456]|nr:unnamed protein product [Symbiodinium sp. CCMP2456]
MASDIARGLYKEQARDPGLPRAPKLPSARLQELHEVTHQPFQPWCQACLMGRSRQSPHEKQQDEKAKTEEPQDRRPVIQIDYCYTFTSEKGEGPGAPEPADDQGHEDPQQQPKEPREAKPDTDKLDTKDQFGCNLVAAESTTGWICVVPVLAKGSSSLKRATEALVRMSMMIAGAEPVVIQGDPEPSIKQLLNSFEACRVRLGLGVVQREAPRGSHASNGVAEKAVSTIRRHALTLKCHLEDRIKAKVGGHTHIFAWLLKHSSFLHNRYFPTNKGLPPFEAVHSKKYVGKLLPFGEACVFHAPSKFKGDLQWQRGVWVGISERSNSHMVLTPDGAKESRSVRRLPPEQQWSAEAVLGCRGLPWDYIGKGRRKKAMYTSVRAPLLPDTATLEQLAKAAGKAAAETIAAATPPPPQQAPAPASPGDAGTKKEKELEKAIRPAQNHKKDHQEGLLILENELEEATPAQNRKKDHQVQCKRSRCIAFLVYIEASWETWIEEVGDALVNEEENFDVDDAYIFDGERPPDLSFEELYMMDLESDKKELDRLEGMGVLRRVKPDEDVTSYAFLTTKVVRDWRRRPTWVRRSRLVAREFKSWSSWSQELFAPASTLATINSLITVAMAEDLEVVSIDIKDAYLNVKQRAPVVIHVDGRLMGHDTAEPVAFILERMLPGQRAAAGEWFLFMKELLGGACLEGYIKEPTLFVHKGPTAKTKLILHADDGLLGSTREEREHLVAKLEEHVTVQVSDVLTKNSGEIEFLKRRYVGTPDGVYMFSNVKHAEALIAAVGDDAKERDTPADQSFTEVDSSKDLEPSKSKLYKEAVGRLLYLSHSRPDLQYATCILASKMSRPTQAREGWCQPLLGGSENLQPGGKIVIESVTDSDWAGVKRDRRSKSCLQIFVSGSMVTSAVRTQKSVALSSGEAEFISMVGGACECRYVQDCLRYMVNGAYEIEARLRGDSAAGRAIAQRVGCGRVRHLDASLLWLQEAVKKQEFKVSAIAGLANPADIGTKAVPTARLRELLYKLGAVDESFERVGQSEHEKAEFKNKAKEMIKSGALGVKSIKQLMPVLLVLSQIQGIEGLSLVAGFYEHSLEDVAALLVTCILGFLVLTVVFGVPGGILLLLQWLTRSQPETARAPTRDAGVPANLGMAEDERLFMEEYVGRSTEQRVLIAEQAREIEKLEKALREERQQSRNVQRIEQVPPRIAIATSRGERYHRPGCGNLKVHVKTYTPCGHCYPNQG